MINEKLNLNKIYLTLVLLGFNLVSSLIINFNQLFKIVANTEATIGTISCFVILSLFFGIYLGVRFHKNSQQKLLWLLVIIAGMQTIFLSRFFIFNFFPLFNYLSENTWWGLFALLFCFSILLLLQLQALSLIFYRLTHGKVIPEYFSAALFYLGTGSFAGVLVTFLITLNYLNLNWAVFINVCIILLVLLIAVENYFGELIKLSFTFGILLLCYAINLQPVAYATLATTRVPQAALSIFQDNQFTYANQKSYADLLQQFLFKDLQLQKQNILVLGDSSFLHEFANGDNQITYLNATSNTQLNACAYLTMLAEGNSVYQDTKQLLLKKYDVIVANLPKNQPQTLNQLLNYNYLRTLRQILAMHGIALFNIDGAYGTEYGKSIVRVFVNCEMTTLRNSGDATQVYVCQRQ